MIRFLIGVNLLPAVEFLQVYNLKDDKFITFVSQEVPYPLQVNHPEVFLDRSQLIQLKNYIEKYLESTTSSPEECDRT